MLCREIRQAAGTRGPRVLVSGRADIALAADLAGVHLGSGPGELTPAEVRRLFPQAYVSTSCHTLAQVRRAREAGVSAILFAPVFGKRVHGVEVVAGVGLDALRQACEAAGPVPVFALGGVSQDKAAACLGAGAAGVAGITLFLGE